MVLWTDDHHGCTYYLGMGNVQMIVPTPVDVRAYLTVFYVFAMEKSDGRTGYSDRCICVAFPVRLTENSFRSVDNRIEYACGLQLRAHGDDDDDDDDDTPLDLDVIATGGVGAARPTRCGFHWQSCSATSLRLDYQPCNRALQPHRQRYHSL